VKFTAAQHFGTDMASMIPPENARAHGKHPIHCLGIFGLLIAAVNARDLGQWDAVSPEIRKWYQALMQPDVPNASCCGEADAYWAEKSMSETAKPTPQSPMAGPTNRAAGLTSRSERRLKFRTTNSSGTGRIQPVTASYS
jgi:hypothetical protein